MDLERQAQFLREHLELLEKEIGTLMADASPEDPILMEALDYQQKAMAFLGKGDLDTARYGFLYAFTCLGLVKRDIKTSAELHTAIQKALRRSPME